MGNPFEDLRQAVVVRPMNSPGPQGAAAPDMKIQYSVDGMSWHDDPVEIDRYLRFSTDNGVSWSDPVYFNNLSETLMWVDKARQWAENPEDSEVEPGQYSALHHASKAAVSASNAAASETNAAESAQNAATSEANAKTSELNAAESAQNAATSEANASASETKARQWAENPEDVEVEPGQYSALHHKEKAINAQTGAETAEANALESANNAATSEANAATSAENAATSEANAKTSEINAAISEANALESANNAYTSEMNAAASEDKAAKWAQEDEDVEVEPGKYSAFHYKEKALAAQIRAEYAAANAELVALGGIPI